MSILEMSNAVDSSELQAEGVWDMVHFACAHSAPGPGLHRRQPSVKEEVGGQAEGRGHWELEQVWALSRALVRARMAALFFIWIRSLKN